MTARSFVNQMSMDDAREVLSIQHFMMGRLLKNVMRWAGHVGRTNEFCPPRMIPEEGEEENMMAALKIASLHREVR